MALRHSSLQIAHGVSERRTNMDEPPTTWAPMCHSVSNELGEGVLAGPMGTSYPRRGRLRSLGIYSCTGTTGRLWVQRLLDVGSCGLREALGNFKHDARLNLFVQQRPHLPQRLRVGNQHKSCEISGMDTSIEVVGQLLGERRLFDFSV